MGNRGLGQGLTSPQIKLYQPKMVCAANSGTPTDPDTPYFPGFQFGRYLLLNPSTVYVEVQMQFVGDPSGTWNGPGTAGVYCISLPAEYPYKRSQPGQIERIPFIGSGMCYLSIVAPFVNVEAIPVPADPWTTLNGREDNYFSAMIPYILDWGTFTLATAASTTVTHDAKYAFQPYDLDVIYKESRANTWWPTNVTGITSSQFVVGVANANPGVAVSAAYKVRGEPPTGQDGALMSPTAPWDWNKVNPATGPFGNFFFSFLYECQT